jgi:heme exporter protein A
LGRALAFWGTTTLDPLGLSHLTDVPVRLLSSGQRRRVALARVAGSGARLWLLDEPLNALDADGATRLDALIANHLAQGGALLAASHQPIAGVDRTLELGR